MTDPEFSRTVDVASIGSTPRQFRYPATPDECAALAARFGWIAIDGLIVSGEVVARDTGNETGIDATGSVEAIISQSCVATEAPVTTTIDQAFAIRFLPKTDAAVPEEVELSDDDLDVMPYAGGEIDLGEAAAQTLALAAPQFPRAPGADDKLRAAGVIDEADAVTGPFAGLKGLLGG